MVRISSISDLHLEFCEAPTLPGGDILLLAGDIFSAGNLYPSKQDARGRSAKRRAAKFCQHELSKYGRVFKVLGNHSHYNNLFEDTAPFMRAYFAEHAPHVTLLDNEAAEIEGVTVLGTTLWARHGVGAPDASEWLIGQQMRDFTAIRTMMDPPPDAGLLPSKRWWLPSDAYNQHQLALAFLEQECPRDRPVILLSHHAQSFQSGHGAEYGTPYFDDAYCANLVDFFQRHDNIKLAVHGHTHHPEHYRIGNTLVVANPRGYFPGERVSRYFDAAAEDIEFDDLFKERLP